MEPFLLDGRPNPPSVPLADRCTINRLPAPGVRPSDPFPGRLRDDPSRAAIRDTYATNTFINRSLILTNTITELFLGYAQQAANEAHMVIYGLDDMGAVIPVGTLENLLVLTEFTVTANKVPVYRRLGRAEVGITWNVDLQGGELLGVQINNTDPGSTVDDITLIFQLFINCDPTYMIEIGRKDNPVP